MRLLCVRLWLIAPLLLLVGCAGTAVGKSNSILANQAPPPSLLKTQPPGSVLAVVRYPAAVDPDAKTTYRSNYIRSPIGGPQSGPAVLGPDAESIADSAILKSNYFALSLYKELAERLPEHSVLLSPHIVKLADDGSLTSEPITRAETAPSILTIDFATYSFPDPNKIMDRVPLTFGDLISPLVVVRADHRAAAPTNGVLFASRPLMPHAGGTGRDSIDLSLANLQAGEFASVPAEHEFISLISDGRTQDITTKSITSIANKNAAQDYPLEKILLDREALEALATDTTHTVDPLEDVFSSVLADRIVSILNTTDMTKAAMVSRAAAISEFDPSLAALSLTGLPDEDFKARMRYTERLLQAEQRYLSVQSLRLFDGIQNGEMGAQVRDMLQAEFEHLEERRKIARQQNTSTAIAIIGAVAAGALAVNSGSALPSNAGEVVLRAATGAAAFRAFSLNQQSNSLNTNYFTSIAPALEQQIDVQVNLIDSSETITAIRFDDLREKLQQLYADNQRAVDTIGTQCGYTHTGDAPVGIWLGVCQNGVAAGSGVGVLRYDDGAAVEYYGYAESGQPSGPGYMIHHTITGESYAFEGHFKQGEPDGIMKITQAGQPDRLRNYVAGEDIGPAPEDAQIVSPFIENQKNVDDTSETSTDIPIAFLAQNSRNG